MSKFYFWLGIFFTIANAASLSLQINAHNWGVAIVNATALLFTLLGLDANVDSQRMEAQINEMERWSVR